MTMSNVPYDPNQGFRADRDLLRQHHLDRGASVGAGEKRQGADRLRQGQRRQAVLRLGRHRHDEPPVRRAVQAAHRHDRRGACALQGRRTRHRRSRQRAHPDDVAQHQRPGARASINAGKISILAINSNERLKAAPDIPTAIEQGVPNMVGQLFLGIYRAGRHAESRHRRDRRAPRKKAVDRSGLRENPDRSGFEPVPLFHRPMPRGSYMAEEFERWKPVVDAIGLKTN